MSDGNKIQYGGGGIGLGGILFIVFLVLKLGVGNTTVMTWNWWWVCSPLWIPIVLIIGILLLIFVIFIIITIIASLLGE